MKHPFGCPPKAGKNILGIFFFLLFAFPASGTFAGNPNIRVVITFDQAPGSYQVLKCPLRYDKDFAYSLTLDDGKDDAYTAAYFLFHGGTVAGNGINYPGLYYTDGCGNNIPFRAGLAWNSKDYQGNDSHNNTPGNMTWNQLSTVYQAGWDVFNHSYQHAAGPGTDYNYQIVENNLYIKNKTGIDITHFVVPSGDTEYTPFAFQNGMKAVYSERDFPGGDGITVNGTVNLSSFRLFRHYLEDNTHNPSNVSTKLDQIASASGNGNNYWYNEFTHRVGFTPSGGSLIFETFEHHMKHIEASYGKSGSDRVWMAPLQEVYEYLMVKQNVSISQQINGNTLTLDLNFSQVPSDLRRYALSLKIQSAANISHIEVNGNTQHCFNSNSKLINLAWNGYPDGDITASVLIPELIRTPCMLAMMQLYPNPTTYTNKINLRINAEIYGNFHVVLYDNLGRSIDMGSYKREQENEDIEIDISALNLASGTYFLKAFSEKQKCAATKVFVKR